MVLIYWSSQENVHFCLGFQGNAQQHLFCWVFFEGTFLDIFASWDCHSLLLSLLFPGSLFLCHTLPMARVTFQQTRPLQSVHLLTPTNFCILKIKESGSNQKDTDCERNKWRCLSNDLGIYIYICVSFSRALFWLWCENHIFASNTEFYFRLLEFVHWHYWSGWAKSLWRARLFASWSS